LYKSGLEAPIIIGVTQILLERYLEHRKHQIEQNEKPFDVKISESVRDYSKRAIKVLSRETTPVTKLDLIYEEEKSDEDEKDFKFSNYLKRRSISGYNSMKSKLTKSRENSPVKQMPHTDEIPPIKQKGLSKLFNEIKPIVEPAIELIIEEAIPIIEDVVIQIVDEVILPKIHKHRMHPQVALMFGISS
jgi:hypothetical protein